VITEDHYIDYLSRTNMPRLIPAQLMSKMVGSHFLFLGYSMRDWNLRVLLKRVWTQQARKSGSWAVDVAPDPIDERFWARHNVDVVRASLEDWADRMEAPGPPRSPTRTR
jgi:SIR2-like domain